MRYFAELADHPDVRNTCDERKIYSKVSLARWALNNIYWLDDDGLFPPMEYLIESQLPTLLEGLAAGKAPFTIESIVTKGRTEMPLRLASCCGLRHTPSLASILRPLPYGELPSLDFTKPRTLFHVLRTGTSPPPSS